MTTGAGMPAAPWVENVPAGWRVARLKSTVRSCRNGLWGDEPNGVDDVICVRVADFDRERRRVRLTSPTKRAIPSVQRIGRSIRRGDLLIEKSGGGELQPVGTVVLYDHDEPAVCSNFVARVEVEADHNANFLCYLHGALYGLRVPDRSIKQTTGIQNLDADSYLNEPVLLPPMRMQRAIADFLDRKSAAIDALIAKKERLVELLQEKRQALMTQAVTKGLDPQCETKESGIPWIGRVPRHWTIVSLKRTARADARTFTDGDWIEAPFITDAGVRLIQTGNVGVGVYREQGYRYVSDATFDQLRCTEVRQGDVLICRLDGPVGRACIAPELGCRMITSVDNAILKPSSSCDARYLVYLLSSPNYLDWVQVLCRVGGGFRFRVSRSMLGDIRVPLPPAAEQRAIADDLDGSTQRLRKVEVMLTQHCAKLREYRQALITAAVTGQLDLAHLERRADDMLAATPP